MRKVFSRRLLVLVLTAFSFSTVFSQSRTISGIIKDENGNVLPGATISVKNTNLNASTNEEGVFKIDVPANAKTLVASYVGKLSKETAIGTQTVIPIVLNSNAVALNDVVVVGYGKAKRSNLTAAQTTITSQQIEKTVNTTIEQALQGFDTTIILHWEIDYQILLFQEVGLCNRDKFFNPKKKTLIF